MKSRRNGAIDFYRFVFSWFVALYHFYGDGADGLPGSCGVEFFLLTSGVFFYRNWRKTKTARLEAGMTDLSGYPYEYAKKRFWRFFPYAAVGYLAALLIQWVFVYTRQGGVLTGEDVYLWLSTDIWELLLLGMNGLNGGVSFRNPAAWTLSAMLISEFVILCVLVRKEKLFYTAICPILLLAGSGWLANNSMWEAVWTGFTTVGVLRCLLLMCLAVYCDRLSERMARVPFTKGGRVVMTFCEFACMALVVVNVMNYGSRYVKFLSTLLLLVSLAISLSGASYSREIFRGGRLTGFLGKLSLTVYLCNEPMLFLWRYYYPETTERYAQVLGFCLSLLGASVVMELMVRGLIRFFSWQHKGIKKLLIASK